MDSCRAGTVTAQDVSQTERELDVLSHHLEYASGLLDRLESRLLIVLRDPNPANTSCGDKKDGETLVRLASAIRSRGNTVQVLNERLDDIINRIEA